MPYTVVKTDLGFVAQAVIFLPQGFRDFGITKNKKTKANDVCIYAIGLGL